MPTGSRVHVHFNDAGIRRDFDDAHTWIVRRRITLDQDRHLEPRCRVFDRRDQFDVAGRSVLAFETFELKGDSPVLYSFMILKAGKAEEDYHISLGSYETINKVAHGLGEIGPADQLFHLDGYYPGGAHRTFGFFRNAPSYETVREHVMRIASGEEIAVSGFSPGSPSPPMDPKSNAPTQKNDRKPLQ